MRAKRRYLPGAKPAKGKAEATDPFGIDSRMCTQPPGGLRILGGDDASQGPTHGHGIRGKRLLGLISAGIAGAKANRIKAKHRKTGIAKRLGRGDTAIKPDPGIGAFRRIEQFPPADIEGTAMFVQSQHRRMRAGSGWQQQAPLCLGPGGKAQPDPLIPDFAFGGAIM